MLSRSCIRNKMGMVMMEMMMRSERQSSNLRTMHSQKIRQLKLSRKLLQTKPLMGNMQAVFVNAVKLVEVRAREDVVQKPKVMVVVKNNSTI